MWIIFALGSGIFSGTRRFLEKKLTKDLGIFTIGWMIQAFALPVLFIFSLWSTHYNIFALPWDFWWPLLIICIVLYPFQSYCYFRSIRDAEISFVLPFLSLIPVWNALTSWFILKEEPSALGLTGISTIILAIYILLSNGKRFPARADVTIPAILMIAGGIVQAFGNSLDKISIGVSDPYIYAFINTLGATICLFIFALVCDRHRSMHVGKNLKGLITIGSLNGLSYWFFVSALAVGLTSYVLAVRSINIIIPALLGFFFLKEKLTHSKIIALILVAVGLVLLAFS